jgi:signal transduction histidine kinase
MLIYLRGDLTNQLAGVRGLSALARPCSSRPGCSAPSVEWIIDDGNWASEGIRRVRALGKKTDIEKAALDINDIVREVIALVQRELFRHHVSVRMDLAPALPTIPGDRVQLQQVIINLVMNAIEAMQSIADRPRELVIRSRQDEPQQALVSVTDYGVGISAENADRLFNAFFTKSSGMGILGALSSNP